MNILSETCRVCAYNHVCRIDIAIMPIVNPAIDPSICTCTMPCCMNMIKSTGICHAAHTIPTSHPVSQKSLPGSNFSVRYPRQPTSSVPDVMICETKNSKSSNRPTDTPGAFSATVPNTIVSIEGIPTTIARMISTFLT